MESSKWQGTPSGLPQGEPRVSTRHGPPKVLDRTVRIVTIWDEDGNELAQYEKDGCRKRKNEDRGIEEFLGMIDWDCDDCLDQPSDEEWFEPGLNWRGEKITEEQKREKKERTGKWEEERKEKEKRETVEKEAKEKKFKELEESYNRREEERQRDREFWTGMMKEDIRANEEIVACVRFLEEGCEEREDKREDEIGK